MRIATHPSLIVARKVVAEIQKRIADHVDSDRIGQLDIISFCNGREQGLTIRSFPDRIYYMIAECRGSDQIVVWVDRFEQITESAEHNHFDTIDHAADFVCRRIAHPKTRRG